MSVNKVILMGNIGKDPESRYLSNGQMVTNLSLCTSEKYVDKQGQKKEKKEWHRLVCFNKTAEMAAKYLTKGRTIYVEGKICYRSFDDKNGVKKYTTDIFVNQIQFVGGDKNNQQKPIAKPQQKESNGFAYACEESPLRNANSNFDIPF